MGIKSLNPFLRNKCPHVFHEIHISEYSFKKVAIDISLYLYKYKASCDDQWPAAFINLIACLRRNEIHCVFIYDTGAPPEKAEVARKERDKSKQKSQAKIDAIKEARDHYVNTGEARNILVDIINKKNGKLKRLLGNSKPVIDLNIIQDEIDRLEGQQIKITDQDIKLTKELFDILEVPYFQAILEAETTCADLCLQGEVDAVLSEDTDLLAYFTPIFLSKINTYSDTCVRIFSKEVIESLELTKKQFLDLCIMSGTDYNYNIKGIGCAGVYKLLKEHGDIDGVKKNTDLDVKILNHVRGRDIFTNYTKLNVKVPYCGHPDFAKLSKFVFKYNITIDIDKLNKDFAPAKIVIEE